MQQQLGLSKQQQNLIKEIGGLSISLGLCKAVYNNNDPVISHMPVSFYPYLLTVQTYNRLIQNHCIWQKLFVKISEDRTFITNLAQRFCHDDPFMTKFLQIYKLKNNQQVGVACTRVDYMGDELPQLVQYNLMSVGLNAMSDRVQDLHTILNKYNSPVGKYRYPVNKNQQTLCNALCFALKQANLNNGLILMVVHEKQFNYGDHYAFKLEMLKKGRPVQNVTMSQLIQKMQYQQDTGIALYDSHQIDAFYFRTGYAISQFPTEQHWIVREKIEKSRAIKFPSVEMILINSKRMQSQIAKKQILLNFLDERETNILLSVQGQIHDFDNKTDQQLEELIKKTERQDYVLKPNREGGGNNFFGQNATKKLKELYQQRTHLRNYILMKKISSKSQPNYFILSNDKLPAYIEKATAQFSTLGCFVYKNNKILLNEVGGTLVRLKREEVNQGGIAINQGVISGVCIVNYNQ